MRQHVDTAETDERIAGNHPLSLAAQLLNTIPQNNSESYDVEAATALRLAVKSSHGIVTERHEESITIHAWYLHSEASLITSSTSTERRDRFSTSDDGVDVQRGPIEVGDWVLLDSIHPNSEAPELTLISVKDELTRVMDASDAQSVDYPSAAFDTLLDTHFGPNT